MQESDLFLLISLEFLLDVELHLSGLIFEICPGQKNMRIPEFRFKTLTPFSSKALLM